MEMESPQRIAIIGAGPVGLETALYARCLGYEVDLIERGQVADSVRGWGHVKMFTPFRMNRSVLGLQAIRAQDESYQPPADDDLISGQRWVDDYLVPVARSDLVASELLEHTEVIAIGRAGADKRAPMGDERTECGDFELLLADMDGRERRHTARIVIDTSGVSRNPNRLGAGGIPAIGERPFRNRILFGIPDVVGARRHEFAGQHTMVVGAGYSAATNVAALAELAQVDPESKIFWVTRRTTAQPIRRIVDDSLRERDRLASLANDAAVQSNGAVIHLAGSQVAEIRRGESDSSLVVRLSGEHAGEYPIHHLIANVGSRPDRGLYRELQVHECYASEGPLKLAAHLMSHTSADCLDQTSGIAETLVCPEPNFFILGTKSYGRNSNFLFALGLEQIRETFAILGERADLNLYSMMEPSS